MTNQGTILGAVLFASLVVGCAADSAKEFEEFEFRQSDGLGEMDLDYPGDGDIEIRSGDDDDVDLPDIIIWDIDGGNVTRQVEPGVFEYRLSVTDDDVYEASPNFAGLAGPSCTAIEGTHPSGEEFKLIDADGTVALTLWKNFVFIGDVDIPVELDNYSEATIEAQAAFSFLNRRIYAGDWHDDQVLAIASKNIAESSPMRRLTLGALVAAECGSDGMP
ncbi:MAG: hypothetical protein AAGF11_39950 [Myxococcota bacterium]